MTKEAVTPRRIVVAPLFQLQRRGSRLLINGRDSKRRTRLPPIISRATEVAKYNIRSTRPPQNKYFTRNRPVTAARLKGRNRYTATFPKGLTPPVNGFWSLTLQPATISFAAERDTAAYAIDSNRTRGSEITRRRLIHPLCAGRSAAR